MSTADKVTLKMHTYNERQLAAVIFQPLSYDSANKQKVGIVVRIKLHENRHRQDDFQGIYEVVT